MVILSSRVPYLLLDLEPMAGARATAALASTSSVGRPSYASGDAHRLIIRESNAPRFMDKHAIVSIEDRLCSWRQAEQAAAALEQQVAGMGQAAADPRAAEIFGQARTLRQEADRQFASILRAIRMDEPAS